MKQSLCADVGPCPSLLSLPDDPFQNADDLLIHLPDGHDGRGLLDDLAGLLLLLLFLFLSQSLLFDYVLQSGCEVVLKQVVRQPLDYCLARTKEILLDETQ